MKHNFIKKLIATSVITSSIFSICPTTTFATGVNYSGVGQTRGQWSKQGENWYYYLGGQIQKGWIYDITGWYYADQKGVMQTGVIQIGSKIYLFADSGVMQTGNVVINGKLYTAAEDGAFYGDELPMPVKAFDWFGTDDNVKHPSQVIDSDKDDSSSTNPTIAYDPLAPKEKFQITFKDEDGEDLKIKNVVDGENITLYKPTKKGYKFVEWNTKKNGNGDSYDYDEDIKITKDLKLYAVWEEVEVTDDNSEELGIVKVEDITITSEENEITTDKGTIKLTAKVLPINASNDDVEWSVENKTGKATISSSGLLTAEADGTIIVKATAEDGSDVYDTMVITISGQKTETQDPSNPDSPTDPSNPDNPSGGDIEAPVITGDEVMINNATTSTTALEGNSYSTIRIDRKDKTILKNVKAESLIINGGTELELNNCQINKVYVLQPDGTYKLTLNGGTTVGITNIESGTELYGSGYKTVNINTTDVVKVQNSAAINTLNVTEEISKIKIEGNVGILNVASTAMNSVFEGNGTINKLVVNCDIKLGVQNVTATEGTGTVITVDSNKNLVEKAQALELATKALEKAESTKLESDIDKAEELINKVDGGIYQQEKEKLNDRLNRLNTAYTENQKIAEAKAAVKALENAVAIDPVSIIKLNVTTGSSVEIGNTTTTNALLEAAQKSIYTLTAGISDRNSLQELLNKQKTIINKETALKDIINATSYTDTTPTPELYKAASILNVTSGESVKLTNKYVSQVKNNSSSGFKEISADLIKDNNSYGIVNALEKDRKLIKAAKEKADSVISNKNSLISKISEAEKACNKLYGTLDNADKLSDGVTYSDIVNVKEKLKFIEDKISDLKKLDPEQISEYQTEYDEILTRLKEAAILLCERDVNALFKDDIASGNIIKDNITLESIESARKQLENVIELFGITASDEEYERLTNYSVDVSRAIYLYNEKLSVFTELKNMVTIDPACAAYSNMSLAKDSSNSGYTASIKLPTTDATKYSIDNGNIVFSGASSQYFVTSDDAAVIKVNIASSGDVHVTESSTITKNIKVAEKSTDTVGDVTTTRVILKPESIPETSIKVTKGSINYSFNFKVNYSNGTFTIIVNRLTQIL
ncbi:MAG: hypothetical protein E7208_12240 [Clostridium butyricum]|nr:hypothetical protein [Clostridium butyricum]